MATLNEIASRVRTERLFSPRPQKPGLHEVLGAVLTHTQNLYNEASNSNEAWATGKYFLTVNANQEDYLLVLDGSAGKILLVTTWQPTNPNHIERPINFYDVQNLNFEWDLPANVGIAGWWNWDGSPNTAARIAFYNEDGSTYARIKPIPQQTAQYRILYTIGDWVSSAGIASSPILSNHHQLIEVRAARSVLPAASWFDDDVRDAAKRKEIWASINEDERLFQAVWQLYIGSFRQHRMSYRKWSGRF